MRSDTGIGAELSSGQSTCSTAKKRLLRDLDRADLLHPPLSFLLLLEQLPLARDVAAIALGEHVLPQRACTVVRAMTLVPIAAWIATSKS